MADPGATSGSGLLRLAGQLLAYVAFALLLGYFSASPAYQHMDPEKALLKMSFSRAGERQEECRRISAEELAELAPNMRQTLDCSRRRVSVVVEIILDGAVLYREAQRPTGLWRDGPSTFYERFAITAGAHTLTARLRESKRAEGFDYVKTAHIDVQPRQNFLIAFQAETGGFSFE